MSHHARQARRSCSVYFLHFHGSSLRPPSTLLLPPRTLRPARPGMGRGVWAKGIAVEGLIKVRCRSHHSSRLESPVIIGREKVMRGWTPGTAARCGRGREVLSHTVAMRSSKQCGHACCASRLPRPALDASCTTCSVDALRPIRLAERLEWARKACVISSEY